MNDTRSGQGAIRLPLEFFGNKNGGQQGRRGRRKKRISLFSHLRVRTLRGFFDKLTPLIREHQGCQLVSDYFFAGNSAQSSLMAA